MALLDESFIVDVFRVSSSTSIDWVYRNTGELHTEEDLGSWSGPPGRANGYQYITNVRRGTTMNDTWRATWTAGDQGMQVISVDARSAEYIVGEGFAEGIDRREPMVIVRRGAGLPVFKTVLEPYQNRATIRQARDITADWPTSFPKGSRWRGTAPGAV